jgi:hypothetical protein
MLSKLRSVCFLVIGFSHKVMEFPVKLLLTPVMIIWVLLLFTVLQQWRAQRRLPRAATFTLLLFWLFCTKPFVDQLAKPLELAYPAYPATTSTTQPLAHILVLGCNHQDSSFLPLTSKAARERSYRRSQPIPYRICPAICHCHGRCTSKNCQPQRRQQYPRRSAGLYCHERSTACGSGHFSHAYAADLQLVCPLWRPGDCCPNRLLCPSADHRYRLARLAADSAQPTGT